MVLAFATLAAILLRLAAYDHGGESALFHPHGYCYLWLPSLVATHVIADLLIGLSYVAISVTLVYLVWKTRRGLPFSWVFVAFGAFIVACGATHFMEIWTLWQPVFWLSADVKIVTAVASVATAIALPPLIPKVLTLIEEARLSQDRRIAVERAHAELEQRVEERTADLAAALERAEQANRAREAFLTTVSHELRTPLNAIMGWSDILARQPNLELMRRAVPVIRRNALAQARMVGDLLDVSSASAGKLRLDPAPTDLRSVVDNAADAVRPEAEAKNLTLTVTGEPSAIVHGDAARLQQIAWNLLSNAVKFTPDGGAVTVSVATTDHSATVEVTDTGVGIDPVFLPNIFERFSQADVSTTRGSQGLGLGLAIVRHLVELHGGTVRASSAGRGHGAAFTVELPLLAAAASSSAERADAAPARNLQGLRVLVVDDDEDSRETTGIILESAGARTVRVDSARAALEQVLTDSIDVIVADIAMPERDGLSLIRDVRRLADGRKRWIPAVALTAMARPEDRERALAAGFQKHVSKPISAAELVTCVLAAMETARAER